MTEIKWIKIVTDLFDDEKIRQIKAMKKGDTFIVIWFELLCLAGKSNSNGFLMLTDKIPYSTDMLANLFPRDSKYIDEAIDIFERFEMIEIIEEKICLLNWEKHQNAEKLEKIREQTRSRVNEHRQKHIADSRHNDNSVTGALQDHYSNTDVTQQNKNKNKEEDKEFKDKDKNKDIALTSFTGLINEYTDNDNLKIVLKDYNDMRHKMSKGFSVNALNLILNKLSKIAEDDSEKIAIVNQSIENTWKGVFPLKNQQVKKVVEQSNQDKLKEIFND